MSGKANPNQNITVNMDKNPSKKVRMILQCSDPQHLQNYQNYLRKWVGTTEKHWLGQGLGPRTWAQEIPSSSRLRLRQTEII